MNQPSATQAITPAVPAQPVFATVGPEPSLLGESPHWHIGEQALYWCDIPGRRLNRFDPSTGGHSTWSFSCEPSCVAAAEGGGFVLAMRDGLWRFSTQTGERTPLAPPPYDTTQERFNDGKTDAQGRFWVGTIYEPRQPALASLHCWREGQLHRMAADVTNSNGLAWSPDGRTQYWSDTKAHTVYRMAFNPEDGSLGERTPWARFPEKQAGQPLDLYTGRPDGATVDAQGCYWVAMFEGQRLLRLNPQGEVIETLHLPVRCPTMPCFGGPDLRTLYITTARENRPADELAQQPLAGFVLQIRLEVPGLPPYLAKI
jgi:sugar lactone lactonase YvrE